jgi:hypothetical protein
MVVDHPKIGTSRKLIDGGGGSGRNWNGGYDNRNNNYQEK